MLKRFRPVFSLTNVVAFIMMAYAAGVWYTPNSGITSYLNDYTFVTPGLIAIAFVGCGSIIFFCRPAPAIFSLLTSPILMYSIGGFFFFFSIYPDGSFTGVIGHVGLWAVITAALYERARSGRAH